MLIVNPFATSTTASGRDALVNTLSARFDLLVEHTTHRGHAGELAARAHSQGFDTVIVHGGDGSVNEAANGLLGPPDGFHGDLPRPSLAVLPGGSANVFARSLGIERDALRATAQLADLLAEGSTRQVSLGHTLDRWFLFNCGMGIDAIVVKRMEAKRRAGRPATAARYLRTTVHAFLDPKVSPPTFTAEIPGREPVVGARFGFVSNTGPWTYLGEREIRTNPDTGFDTGLGVFVATSMSLPRTLPLAARLLLQLDPKAGHLLRADDVEWAHFRSAEPADVQMDGDYLGTYTDLSFGYRKDVLTVVAPTAS